MGQAALATPPELLAFAILPMVQRHPFGFPGGIAETACFHLAGHSGVNSEHHSTLSAGGQQALAVFCF